MRNCLLLFGCIFIGVQKLYAQPTKNNDIQAIKRICRCEELPMKENQFGDETEAQKEVDKLAVLVGVKIQDVLEIPQCTANARALKCKENKYILYNNKFLDEMQKKASWAERFVMAHEIGHHLHLHTDEKNVFNDTRLPKISIEKHNGQTIYCAYKINRKGDSTRIVSESTLKLQSFYQHLKEFQADATATWILFQRGIKKDELESIWTQYTLQTQQKAEVWSTTHPSISTRKKHTLLLWEALCRAQPLSKMPSTSQNTSKSYEKTIQKATRLIRDKETKNKKKVNVTRLLSGQAVSNFIFDLSENAFGSDSTGLSPSEQLFWEYIQRKHKFTIEPVIGMSIANNQWTTTPQMYKENALLAQFTRPSAYVGAKLTWLSWYNFLWLESSVVYKRMEFATYDTQNNLKYKVEQFKWQGVQIAPQVILTTVSNKRNYQLLKQGLYVSIGGSLDIPCNLNYQNFHAPSSVQFIRSMPSLSPIVGVGLIQLSRDKTKINARLGLTYQAQKIILKNYKEYPIHVPQIGIQLSARCW
jgi:hypothetical protein